MCPVCSRSFPSKQMQVHVGTPLTFAPLPPRRYRAVGGRRSTLSTTLRAEGCLEKAAPQTSAGRPATQSRLAWTPVAPAAARAARSRRSCVPASTPRALPWQTPASGQPSQDGSETPALTAEPSEVFADFDDDASQACDLQICSPFLASLTPLPTAFLQPPSQSTDPAAPIDACPATAAPEAAPEQPSRDLLHAEGSLAGTCCSGALQRELHVSLVPACAGSEGAARHLNVATFLVGRRFYPRTAVAEGEHLTFRNHTDSGQYKSLAGEASAGAQPTQRPSAVRVRSPACTVRRADWAAAAGRGGCAAPAAATRAGLRVRDPGAHAPERSAAHRAGHCSARRRQRGVGPGTNRRRRRRHPRAGARGKGRVTRVGAKEWGMHAGHDSNSSPLRALATGCGATLAR